MIYIINGIPATIDDLQQLLEDFDAGKIAITYIKRGQKITNILTD